MHPTCFGTRHDEWRAWRPSSATSSFDASRAKFLLHKYRCDGETLYNEAVSPSIPKQVQRLAAGLQNDTLDLKRWRPEVLESFSFRPPAFEIKFDLLLDNIPGLPATLRIRAFQKSSNT